MCYRVSCWAYDGIGSDITPCPLLSFALLLKDVDKGVVDEFAACGLWEPSHGFFEWSCEHAAWDMDSISLYWVSAPQQDTNLEDYLTLETIPWYRSGKRQRSNPMTSCSRRR